MKNNELKDKVLKNVKENIAISNICEEIGMDKKKERKFFVYKTLSACAAVILIGAVFVNNLNVKQIGNSLAQNAADNILVGKNESDMVIPGIQSSNSAMENKNDVAGVPKDPMTDSAPIETENNRGESTEDLKQNANSEVIVADKDIYDVNDAVEVFSIKKLIKNIIEVISSIFEE